MTGEEHFARLERIMEGGFATLADLLRETNSRLGRLESRFDNFLETAGSETRRLRADVDDLTERVERLEKKSA